MKKSFWIVIALGVLAVIGAGVGSRLQAADGPARYQYAEIRRDGRDRTFIVWPDGNVEFQQSAMASMVVPLHTDERAVLLTALINKLAAQGYEVEMVTNGEQVLMRRALR